MTHLNSFHIFYFLSFFKFTARTCMTFCCKFCDFQWHYLYLVILIFFLSCLIMQQATKKYIYDAFLCEFTVNKRYIDIQYALFSFQIIFCPTTISIPSLSISLTSLMRRWACFWILIYHTECYYALSLFFFNLSILKFWICHSADHS